MAHSVDPMSDKQITRPPFREALAAWREFLATQKLPAEPLWIFAENLCFEPSSAIPGSLRVGFQKAPAKSRVIFDSTGQNP